MMTTPFWQVRNRDFLTHKPKRVDIDETWLDMIRQLCEIHVNNTALLTFFVRELESLAISTNDKNPDEIEALIKEHLNKDHLFKILKEQLFATIADEDLKNKYVEVLSKVLNQGGLIFAANQSLQAMEKPAEQGYFIGSDNTSTRVNISLAKNGGIIIDERCDLTHLKTAAGIVENKKNTPLMTIKNRFHLLPGKNGKLYFSNTDLAIEYHNKDAKVLYDERGLLTKIKDFFKSLFKMNGIEEFSLEKESALLQPNQDLNLEENWYDLAPKR